MRTPRFLGSVVAGLLATTGLVLGAPAPATADVASHPMTACEGRTGVIVVVDFNELGGISKGCDADGGNAADNFADAGYVLTEAQGEGMDGFVCQVDGLPADRDCTETDGYWSLWWADGKGGGWKYATLGVRGLQVPAGGYVAFAWKAGPGQNQPPDVVPAERRAAATPSPSPSASSGGTRGNGGSGSGSGDARQGGSTGSPGAGPSTGGTRTGDTATDPSSEATSPDGSSRPAASDEPSSAASGEPLSIDEVPEAGADPSTARVEGDGGGFPIWAGIGLGGLVLGAAGAVPVLRRRGL